MFCLVGLQSILVPTQIQLAHLVLSDYYCTGLYLAYEVTSCSNFLTTRQMDQGILDTRLF